MLPAACLLHPFCSLGRRWHHRVAGHQPLPHICRVPAHPGHGICPGTQLAHAGKAGPPRFVGLLACPGAGDCDWCRFRLPCQAPHAGTVCAATALHDDISSWLRAAASINPATSLAAACPLAETGLGQCCAAGVCWHLLQRCAYHHSGTVRGHTGHGLGYRLGHGGCGGSSGWRIAQWSGAEVRLASLVRQIVACGCACRASCCHPACTAVVSSQLHDALLVAVRCFIGVAPIMALLLAAL